jgi:hypothetical protein|tara:strand:- start:253 stop:495 length:243 start_codon:yes stop_codon:yes gene_type:complete
MFETYHGISEKLLFCDKCKLDSLIRIPYNINFKLPNRDYSEILTQSQDRNVGDLVERFIEESREELKQQQDDLQNKREIK